MYLFCDYNGRIAATILRMLHRRVKSGLSCAPDCSFAQEPLNTSWQPGCCNFYIWYGDPQLVKLWYSNIGTVEPIN